MRIINLEQIFLYIKYSEDEGIMNYLKEYEEYTLLELHLNEKTLNSLISD